MKFDCGPDWSEVKAALEEWHPFFAIWPRKVGPRDCRWLERIERRGTYNCARGRVWWRWEYRAAQSDNT